MYVVPMHIAQSEIHGIGIFASRNISKGEVVWKFNPAVDREFTSEEIEACPPRIKLFLETFAYSEDNKRFVLCCDGGMFCNHSPNANTTTGLDDPQNTMIASRDILAGEEILSNYDEFDVTPRLF